MAIEILSERYETLTYAHTAAVASKAFLAVGSLVLMALSAYAANESGPYVYETPRLRVPKATGQAWTVGAKIYWDAAAGKFTTVATGNTLAGIVVEAAASADSEGKIHLTPFA